VSFGLTTAENDPSPAVVGVEEVLQRPSTFAWTVTG
jgi:hypothetical protein